MKKNVFWKTWLEDCFRHCFIFINWLGRWLDSRICIGSLVALSLLVETENLYCTLLKG